MKELSPPALNLKRLVKETVPGEPILIVISPGADPSQVGVLFVRYEQTITRNIQKESRAQLFESRLT